MVYSGEFTVAELAKAIELKEIEQAGADYQDLLEELEGLSDEEVRALLAEEQDALVDPGPYGASAPPAIVAQALVLAESTLLSTRRTVQRRSLTLFVPEQYCSSAHAHSADRQRLLRAAARRRHAQQPDLAGPPGAAGHDCRIVCGAAGEGAELRFHESIAVIAVEDPARRVQVLRQQIREFQPDWVLVSSEDLGHALLREAHHSAPGRVVYLAHTPQFYPFGPASWNPDRHAARTGGAVAPESWPSGSTWRGTSQRALGRAAAVIHPPIYGRGPFAAAAASTAGWSP